jgi:hypothetical protein
MQTDGRALVEATFSLDIRPLVRAGAIRDDVRVDGVMRFGAADADDDDVRTIAFEVSTRDPARCWLRLRCTVINRWTNKQREIDDEIRLTTSRAGFVGRQWLFVCPALGVRVRELYLPDGARHFRSRQAYDLAYETEHLDDRERAWRRVRKLRRQLDSDPDGIGQPYPEKPPRLTHARYARLLARLEAAEDDLGLPLTRGGPRFAYRHDRGPAQRPPP